MKKKIKEPEKLLVLAGLFIGLGIGIYMDKTSVGVLIGLGAGFLAAFFYTQTKKKK